MYCKLERMESYLKAVRKQFTYYRQLGEKTFAQLAEADIHWRPDPEANSIAIIVNHLSGNMLSRWTNFLDTDGEKDWRNREQEFATVIESLPQLHQAWEAGWKALFTALDQAEGVDLEQVIYIRNIGHTITEALNRQMAHYAYHIGQIVYIGRLRKGLAWESLSIPRGGSEAYNAKKFAQEKHRGHFTDEFLDQPGT